MKAFRKIVSILIIYAIVANAVFIAMPKNAVANDINAAEMTRLFGEKVFICTPDGYKWVKWSELEKEQNHPKKNTKCSLCLVSCSGAAANISQLQFESVTNYGSYNLQNSYKQVYVTLQPYNAATSRSPPVPSVI